MLRQDVPRFLLSRRCLMALVCAVGLAACSLAAAQTWLGPSRPLSDTERLALTVSKADGIVIASVVGMRDSTFQGSPIIEGDNSSSELLPYQDLVLHPHRWIKGDAGPGDLHVTLISRMDLVGDDIARATTAGGAITGIFFLRRTPKGWGVEDYPVGYNRGHLARLDAPHARTPALDAIEAMAARQSLDSLLLRADLVVVGHWKLAPRGAHGRPLYADSLIIDQILAGSESERAIVVTSPVIGAVDVGRAGVFFLRRQSAARYEPLDLFAGDAPLQGDSLLRLGIRLDRVVTRAVALQGTRKDRAGVKP